VIFISTGRAGHGYSSASNFALCVATPLDKLEGRGDMSNGNAPGHRLNHLGRVQSAKARSCGRARPRTVLFANGTVPPVR
jgi:hypothetical protein